MSEHITLSNEVPRKAAVAYPAAHGLRGAVTVPGDKSISHRALMFASQALGTTTIEGLLESEDVHSTAGALRALGVQIEQGESHWRVQGVGVGGLNEPDDVLDMGNSGTSTRLMMGLLASYPFTSFFTGDASLRSRPMQRVITPLQQVGAHAISRSAGRLPLALVGTASAIPITYTLPVASAQVKSAVLLAGLNTAGTTTVIEPEPTRDHTERMLQDFGADITVTPNPDGAGNMICLQGQPELLAKDKHIIVPGDPSSAAFMVVAALIVPGSDVTVHNVCLNPLRTGVFVTLQEMGADLTYINQRVVGGEDVADIVVRSSVLKGVDVPATRAPSMIDEYPILGVAAAFATGDTTMHGLHELRVKESDRLQAMIDGLHVNGLQTSLQGDTLTVHGGKGRVKGGGEIHTKHDHRTAMSFLVMGLASQEPVVVDDISAIATSFPEFRPMMKMLGGWIARITWEHRTDAIVANQPPEKTNKPKPLIIAIDGPAASGKGTLARRLASYFGYGYLDTGRLYRAVGLKLLNSGGNPENSTAATAAAYALAPDDLLNPRLREEEVGKAASIVSAHPDVRKALLEYQRNFAARAEGAVLDGRDIATVVCPDADIKLFVTANLKARAKRRYAELLGYGVDASLASVEKELEARDSRDSKRDAAPLMAAQSAVHIDTSDLSAAEVFETVLGVIQKAQKAPKKR